MNKIIISFALLTVTFLIACKQQSGEEQMPMQELASQVIKEEAVESEQTYAATITGLQDVEIMPQVQGTITKINVKEGQRVRKGQVLFVINRVPYEAELRTAKAGVQAAQVQLSNAQMELASKEQLRKERVVSDYELTLARNAVETAKAQLEQARASVMNASNSLSYTSVTAPVNGVVGVIPYRVGALVGPSMTQALTTLSDNDEMYAYFSLPEREVRKWTLKYDGAEKAIVNMPRVKLQMGDGTTHEEEGRIESMAGLINQQTGTVQLRAVFGNKKHLLLSGSIGSVMMKQTNDKAVVISQKSTVDLQDKVFVFVHKDGKVQQRAITTEVLKKGHTYIVTSGLKPGERIITEGVAQLQDGMEVGLKK